MNLKVLNLKLQTCKA